MTIFDDKLGPVVAQYGKTVTWETYGSKDYDRTTGAVTVTGAGATTLKVSPPKPLQVSQTDGVTLKVGDSEFYMLAGDVTFTPRLTDSVLIDGVSWKCVQIDDLTYQDAPAGYRVVVRR